MRSLTGKTSLSLTDWITTGVQQRNRQRESGVKSLGAGVKSVGGIGAVKGVGGGMKGVRGVTAGMRGVGGRSRGVGSVKGVGRGVMAVEGGVSPRSAKGEDDEAADADYEVSDMT